MQFQCKLYPVVIRLKMLWGGNNDQEPRSVPVGSKGAIYWVQARPVANTTRVPENVRGNTGEATYTCHL